MHVQGSPELRPPTPCPAVTDPPSTAVGKSPTGDQQSDFLGVEPDRELTCDTQRRPLLLHSTEHLTETRASACGR